VDAHDQEAKTAKDKKGGKRQAAKAAKSLVSGVLRARDIAPIRWCASSIFRQQKVVRAAATRLAPRRSLC
jgi:hypothetical protein